MKKLHRDSSVSELLILSFKNVKTDTVHSYMFH